ncbi:YmfQ family protein [Ancylobacter oerskovii]|uniref:YmfQ family protein n=1 Tax=Ancylobacter oerskovii TaxID=459519 RepID=A0ABW4Z3C2_9HYPH|nr:putative phage tail protein [Ancylobacter oerskovii]MBS7546256.1 DUF2313 domain-containing protein [Ancylobacter oerskovii]
MSDTPIQHTGEDYGGVMLAVLPPGDAWPRETGSPLQMFSRGQAEIWGRLDAEAWNLVTIEAHPDTTFRLLEEWEAAAGLPDPCVAEPLGIEDRRNALVQRLTSTGGQSRAYFLGIAAQLGYEVSIVEITPFMCGLSQCGGSDPLGPPSIAHHWWIIVTGYRVTWFRAGLGRCGVDPFARIALATDLECTIRPLQPAHGVLHFSYS